MPVNWSMARASAGPDLKVAETCRAFLYKQTESLLALLIDAIGQRYLVGDEAFQHAAFAKQADPETVVRGQHW